MSCAPTEPVEKHDDISVLQDFINNSSGTLLATLDTDSSGVIEPLELGEQTWNNNGRIIILNCDSIGLSGRIPESIGALTELTQLGLKNNNLSGEIPESIGNLTQLTQLSLSKNSLSGAIPDTIGNLKSLWRLDLSYNQLSGTLPGSLSNLSILEVLLANSNNLSGAIPQDICIIYNPNYNFELSGNQFCPPLPYCIDSPNLIGYQNCDTSCGSGNTYLNGYCYSQSDLDVLQGLIDSANSLNMVMDTDTIAGVQSLELGFQEWQSGRLKTLDCYWDTVSCNLSTDFPVNIINLDSLEYLDIQQNNITGGIPEALPDLTNLKDLNISDNQLSGYLPESLCIDDTTVWTNINLKNNQFCPCYPACISSIDINSQTTDNCVGCGDGFLQFCTYSENVTFYPLDSTSMCFNESDILFLDTLIINSYSNEQDSLLNMQLDLNSNENIEQLEIGIQEWSNDRLININAIGSGLSGNIPNAIGDLDSLIYLYLANNHLTGSVPESIGNLSKLYVLDLSKNQLSGEIPESIVNLQITKLLLHNNLFSGNFPEIICEDLELNWSDELLPGSSSIFNNQLCPPYPECIKPFVGVQDTSSCSQSEAP